MTTILCLESVGNRITCPFVANLCLHGIWYKKQNFRSPNPVRRFLLPDSVLLTFETYIKTLIFIELNKQAYGF